MAKPTFTEPESKKIWKLVEHASQSSHHDPVRTFRDFLTICRCALSFQRAEDEYLQTIEPYKAKNRLESLCKAFQIVVETPGKDLLGDVFQGGVTFGENGQFFTPDPICRMMNEMNAVTLRENRPVYVNDPACGSGRMMLNAVDCARGEGGVPAIVAVCNDVDSRCVNMAVVNLWMKCVTSRHSVRAYVIHGNTLTLETWRGFYVSKFNGIQELKDPENVMKWALESRKNGSQCEEGVQIVEETDSVQLQLF